MTGEDKLELNKIKKRKYRNAHLMYLIEYLLDKEISIKELEELTGLKEHTIFDEFKVNPIDQQPFRRGFIAKLFFGLHIDCEAFILPEEKEKEFLIKISTTNGKVTANKKKNLFTREYWETIKNKGFIKDTLIEVANLERYDDYDPRIIKIYDSIIEHIEGAKKQIVFHQLLLDFEDNPHIKKKIYRIVREKARKAVLKAIEQNRIDGNTEFRYNRTFHTYEMNDLGVSEGNLINWVTFGLPEFDMAHLAECMTKYPDYCKFYISPLSRYRGQCLIDNEYMINEDYTIGDFGPFLNFIFLDRVDIGSPLNVLIEGVKWDDESKERMPIDYKSLKYAFQAVAQKMKDKEEQLEKETEELEKLVDTEGAKSSKIKGLIIRQIGENYKSIKHLSSLNEKFITNLKIFKQVPNPN